MTRTVSFLIGPGLRRLPKIPRPPSGMVILFQVGVRETERLDRFLADQLAISRTQSGRLIARGAVLINGHKGRASRMLSRGDTVELTLPAVDPPRQIKPLDLPLTVVFEDEHLLVIDKPAGLVVHPAPGHWDDTLVNVLEAKRTSLSTGTGGRPGIVHRLDKDTSGLLIVAKNDDAHRGLAGQIALKHTRREYAALVWGHISEPRDIEAPIARHPGDRKRMTVLATGRHALTSVTPLARFENTDLVRVSLTTGRTHQIRVHLAHVGHPVVGDPVYGGGGSRRVSGAGHGEAVRMEKLASRQALHAALLGFRHPVGGENLEFRSEWPDDLRELLAAAARMPDLLDRPNMLDYLGFFE